MAQRSVFSTVRRDVGAHSGRLLAAPYLLALILAVGAGPVLYAAPHISRALPSAVRAGTTVDVAFLGKDFGPADGPFELWTSVPLDSEVISVRKGEPETDPPRPAEITFRLTVPGELTAGTIVVRLATAWGVSAPLLLLLDEFDSQTSEGGATPRTASRVVTPVAIDGTTAEGGGRFYRFAATAGQRLAFEVIARRLRSDIDPVLRLLTGDGKELAIVDDDASLGADCRLEWVFTTGGEFLLEVRDVLYRRGPFRLRIGDFPLVQSLFPLGGVPGSESTIRFAGVDEKRLPPLRLTLPRAGENIVHIAARYPEGRASSPQSVRLSALPQVLEGDDVVPGGLESTPVRIELPCALDGRIGVPGDVDEYEFTVAAGETIQFRGLSRSLGSPAYLTLELVDARGRTLRSVGTGDQQDEAMVHEFDAGGVHRLRVRDLLGDGGPAHAYRVEIERGPGFDLTFRQDCYLMPPFGTVRIAVKCRRRGYDGPISLTVSGHNGSLRVEQATVRAGQDGATLVLMPRDEVPLEDIEVIKIEGHARIGEQEVRTTAYCATVRRDLEQAGVASSLVEESLFLRPIASPLAPTLQLEELVRGRTALVRLRVERLLGLPRTRVHASWYHLPPGVRLDGRGRLEPDDDELTFTLTVSEDAPLGLHLEAFAEVRMDALDGVAVRAPASLRIRDPERRRL